MNQHSNFNENMEFIKLTCRRREHLWKNNFPHSGQLNLELELVFGPEVEDCFVIGPVLIAARLFLLVAEMSSRCTAFSFGPSFCPIPCSWNSPWSASFYFIVRTQQSLNIPLRVKVTRLFNFEFWSSIHLKYSNLHAQLIRLPNQILCHSKGKGIVKNRSGLTPNWFSLLRFLFSMAGLEFRNVDFQFTNNIRFWCSVVSFSTISNC